MQKIFEIFPTVYDAAFQFYVRYVDPKIKDQLVLFGLLYSLLKNISCLLLSFLSQVDGTSCCYYYLAEQE